MKLALVFAGCHRRGGVERLVWEAARHWRHEHEVTVVAADIDETDLDGVELRRVAISRPTPWRFGRAARQAYRLDEFDQVISFGVQPVPATILWVNSVHRAWLEASRRFPGSSRLRDPRLRYLTKRHLERLYLERRYFRAPGHSLIVVVADAVGDDLVRLYGVDRRLLTTVHNGFDPAEFDPNRRARDRISARNEWHLPEHAVVLAMVANELPRKGYDVALRAIGRLREERLHLVLAGTADPSSYSELTADLGLVDRVHYVGPQSDVGKLHAASDVFVLPTKYEAFCLAIVEALASGLPVVTTTVPGAGDLITPGRNGLLLGNPDDDAELAELLRQASDDRVRAELAANARPSVEHLSWDGLLEGAVARFR